MAFYFTSQQSFTAQERSLATKTALWPFTVLEYHKSGIGAMQGATVSRTEGDLPDAGISEAIGSVAAGAAIGSLLGPPGMIVGALIGGSQSSYIKEKFDKIF